MSQVMSATFLPVDCDIACADGIEAELLLQVNMDKTSVERLSPKVKFLGFGFSGTGG